MLFPGDSSQLERSGIIFGRANGNCFPGSKAFSKIFENFDPEIPLKDSEMKRGMRPKAKSGPNLQLFQALSRCEMWCETRTRGDCTMRLKGLKMRPAGSRRFEANFDFQLERGLASLSVSNSAEFSLATGFATPGTNTDITQHRERAGGQEGQPRNYGINGGYEGFY